MTVTPGSSGPNLTLFSTDGIGLYRTRREAFLFSLMGQAIVVVLLGYFTCCIIDQTSPLGPDFTKAQSWKVVFSGHNGGGGGAHDKLPASHGDLPLSSLMQLAPPTVMHPTKMPPLPVSMSIEVAPDVKYPQGGQLGDPNSTLTKWLSNGPGANGGIGDGRDGGVGGFAGPHFGSGPPGIYPAGKNGVSPPVAIYSPEPDFSDEARKAKQQGIVGLLLVVGADGRAHDIRVRESLGMGLDEKAVEAVSRWRFKPATLNGQAVATQIVVEVEFHLY